MLNGFNRITRRFGLEIRRSQRSDSRHERIISLRPAGRVAGSVLLSYIIDPFLRKEGEPISNEHTHDWESYQIAQTFLDRGFAVDVISFQNTSHVPRRAYDFFVGARTNFERIAVTLNEDCVKVAHLDTAHWLFNNAAAYERLRAVAQRRGVTLFNPKMVEPNWAIERADLATVLGNDFTLGTYSYARKPMHRIRISAPCTYAAGNDKDFERCRQNYLWFGSSGFVHKGLDLVLEAFAEMPEFNLSVCGPIDEERLFKAAFAKELYETPNIRALGWVDVASAQFLEVARGCVGLIYPSCSEGGGGSAITCMHAGIIPIVTPQTSVDIGDSGILLRDASLAEIKERVRDLSSRPASELESMSRNAWQLARRNHTRERFALEFNQFVDGLLQGDERHRKEMPSHKP